MIRQVISTGLLNNRSMWQTLSGGFVLLLLCLPTYGQPLTIDDPTVTNRDRFGRSVEVHGNRILIGALHDDTFGESSGQAHIFDIDGNLLRTLNNPSPEPGDLFGRIVSFDGNRALIGASGVEIDGMDRVGQAFLFDMTTGSLLQTFDDPFPTEGGQFGWGAAIDGNNVLISARQNDTDGDNVGKAYLFDAVSGDLLHTLSDPTPTVRDDFGHFAAIDGDFIIVGAPLDDSKGTDVGQAYLFDVSTGALLHTFDNPSTADGDHFGHSVWVDGENILIGAWGDDTHGVDVGQAYLFNSNGQVLQTYNDPTPTTKDEFSRELAMQGDHVLVGARLDDTFGDNVGQVHLFDRVTGKLIETFDDPTIENGEEFGRSVALDGSNVVVGDYKDGTVGFQVGQVHLFHIAEFVLGDFDGDSVLSADDIDLLSAAINNGSKEPLFDLNSDELVDDGDRGVLVEELLGTFWGDADLDQEVSFGDFLLLSQNFGQAGGWADGDFDGNGEVQFGDFLLLSGNFGNSAKAVSSVPEPDSTELFQVACFALVSLSRRRPKFRSGN